MPSVTITVRGKAGLVVPPSVRRQAGIKAGDRLEVNASRGMITIVAKPNGTKDEYSPDQRRMIDREVAKGLDDVKRGRVHGPFTPLAGTRFIRAELRKRKPK